MLSDGAAESSVIPSYISLALLFADRRADLFRQRTFNPCLNPAQIVPHRRV